MNFKVLIVCGLYILQTSSFPIENQYSNELIEKIRVQVKLANSGPYSNDSFHSKWCGFKSDLRSRRKRYILQGSRWKVNPVTYNITKYPSPNLISRQTVDREIDAAFRMWEAVSNLTFKREWDTKINIDIRFETRNHGDDEPFDGRGSMTAHAYYPNFGGDIHFDADELWTYQSSTGINLFQVATHEIGHALGLEHSSEAGAVMSPYYINYNTNFKLQQDDIEGIQKLYGKKAYSICDESKLDAAVTMVDGATYLFRGNLVYKIKNLDSPVGDPDYPKEISKVFENLSGPIDAALTRPNGVSYFFKGDDVWRFTNMSMDIGFPQKVSAFFEYIPTPLDAAVVFPRDENIYFMKGSYYWKFDHTKNPPVSSDYPRSIAEWKGIPSNLDAAVRLEDNLQPAVFFFKDNYYWKFNDKSSSVYLSNPPYPRHIRTLLPDCVHGR